MSALTGLAGRLLDGTAAGSRIEVRRYDQGGRVLATWVHLATGGWSETATPWLSVSSEALAARLDEIDESAWTHALLFPRRRWWRR